MNVLIYNNGVYEKTMKLRKEDTLKNKKISETLKRKYASGELISPFKFIIWDEERRKKQGESSKGRLTGDLNPAKRPEVREKLKLKALGRKICGTQNTKIEIKLQNELQKNNILFIKHKWINNIEHLYQCDILIEPNLIIECDGDYWHKYPYGNKKDWLRTYEMNLKGYKVLRFWEHEINNEISYCVKMIKLAMQ